VNKTTTTNTSCFSIEYQHYRWYQ